MINAMPLPREIYSIAQIKELERVAQDELNISPSTLMQCAGAAALTALQEYWPRALRIAIVCGQGNNGGDGYVLARLAHARGLDVDIWQVGDADKLKGAALEAAQACSQADIRVHDFADFNATHVDVIVDAILGVGAKGNVRDEVQMAIVAINSADLPVLSLDVPSGLDADTGNVLGVAVLADATVTFVGLKRGLMTHDGIDYCGNLTLDSLQVPTLIFDHVLSQIKRIGFNHYRSRFWPRMRNTHKGDFGYVLIVGGSPGYSGAVNIAAQAAARTGAGLVTVAYHEQGANVLDSRSPEIMAFDIKEADKLDDLLERASAVVLGPGLGTNEWSLDVLQKVLSAYKPTVLDADALNLVAQEAIDLSELPVVITPHPGEAARLLGCQASDIQKNRFDALEQLIEKLGVVTVLKGAGSLIGAPNTAMTYLCHAGNPGMASAGMGDLLSGIIGSLIAQGLSLEEAAKVGVSLHARAGDIVARDDGQRGMLAMDLIPAIRELINPEFEMQ
jgi:ADP-dependent NAD(P)H-hydrate dehydratase / NAD(P)H-hydrate epimerase